MMASGSQPSTSRSSADTSAASALSVIRLSTTTCRSEGAEMSASRAA